MRLSRIETHGHHVFPHSTCLTRVVDHEKALPLVEQGKGWSSEWVRMCAVRLLECVLPRLAEKCRPTQRVGRSLDKNIYLFHRGEPDRVRPLDRPCRPLFSVYYFFFLIGEEGAWCPAPAEEGSFFCLVLGANGPPGTQIPPSPLTSNEGPRLPAYKP